MILLDSFPGKLFISPKPNKPPIDFYDFYMGGVIRSFEKRREEDLEHIDKLQEQLKLKEETLKRCNESMENLSFDLDEKRETIESQKAAILYFESMVKTQEAKIEEWQSIALRWKVKNQKYEAKITELLEELKEKNDKPLSVLTVGDYAGYLEEALNNERKERERLQTILSNIKELSGKVEQ